MGSLLHNVGSFSCSTSDLLVVACRIFLVVVCVIFVVACGILVAACGIIRCGLWDLFNCGMWNLCCGMQDIFLFVACGIF